MKNKKGFTLIEILTVVAIVGVLAGVVLTSMSSHGPKARSVRAQGVLSSAIQPMISCWGNTDNSGVMATVNSPTVPGGGNDICSLGSTYGVWPQMGSGDLSDYEYVTDDITIDNDPGERSSQWSIGIESENDDKKICCNSTMNGCKVIDNAATACTHNSPAS